MQEHLTGAGSVAEGLGFAIPANTATAIASQIMEKGYVTRPYLGINYQPIIPDIANAYRLPAQWGVYITSVSANSPASKAGLRQGDIITSIASTALDETHQYLNILLTHQPGEQVTLSIIRNGQPIEVQVTLGQSNGG